MAADAIDWFWVESLASSDIISLLNESGFDQN